MTYDNALVTLSYLLPEEYLAALTEMAPLIMKEQVDYTHWYLFIWGRDKGVVLKQNEYVLPTFHTLTALKGGHHPWSPITKHLLDKTVLFQEYP